MRLRVLSREPRIPIVHYSDERGSWATRGRDVLHQEEAAGAWRRIARFPRHSLLDGLLASRPACRALRLDRCNLQPTRSGALLAIRGGTLYRVEHAAFVPLCRIQGDCVMNRAIAEAPDGSLYLGEYFSNGTRLPVRIWRVQPDLRDAEVVHVLDAPRVRHVHAIHPDPFHPPRLWFTTGDFRDECYLGYTDDGFESVELIGDGGQRYRAVGLLFESDHLSWLTDSHLEQNRVVAMERESGALSLLGEVESSTWYTVRTTDGVCLATTTVEPGPAIHTRSSRLLGSTDARRWSEVATFEKDAWPMPWFKFGSLSLPAGRYSSERFWLSGEGLRGLDGGSLLCALERTQEAA